MIIAAAVAVLAVAGDDDSGEEVAEPTSSTTATTATIGEQPAAPWRTATVPRSAVPAAYAEAWDRARNNGTCALLFPLDGGPGMEGAEATADRTPNDDGWDIFLTSGAASIEVLGLFNKTSDGDSGQAERGPWTGGFTRTWSDGSVARYGADVGALPPGSSDPNTSPFEAVLTLPDQGCAYRIYDSRGKDHIEATFDRLRLMS